MTYSVKEAADISGIAPTTVRAWVKELAPVLSQSANPKPGMERRFTEDDIAILHTAKVLRFEKVPWDDIIATVQAGQLIMPPPIEQKENGTEGDASQGAIIAADVWERYTAPFTDHIADLEAQRDKLETQLAEAQEKRLAAEKRATVAETILAERKQAAEREIEAIAGHWWQFWK